MRHIAVIGSGPAGYYSAEALQKQYGEDVRVDVIDRMPVPYGLINRVTHLEDFADALCIDKFTLTGNSQGAWAAAQYAAIHPDRVEKLRIHKEPAEVEALQQAVDLGDAAFVHVAERVEPGWTEKKVAWEIEKYIREQYVKEKALIERLGLAAKT